MIPYNVNVKMDFLSDWREFLISQFKQFPFLKQQDYINLPLKKLSILYFNWLSRMIQPAIRKVHYSKEFSCPANLEKGLEFLTNKIRTGQDLTPHLSRKINDITYNDGLLNVWEIHHLHLGVQEERDGFVKRDGDILYALFNENDAYLIQIMDHKSFCKQELVRIIHRNWTEVIEPYKFSDNVSLTHSSSDKDVGLLRKAGINTVTVVDGNVVYGSIGGGITCAGTSGMATMLSNRYQKWITQIEIHVHENIECYAKSIEETLGYSPKELSFTLEIDNEHNFYVYEKNSLIAFDIGKP
ncbi:hypothetical protein [Paenibacillus sp. FSL H3-0286]|uniref:hypothetical protein n=1 Tax=Paenibacillus sp. FSL H3-0286 TaxID=2921427 RepID=UPI00324BC9B6